MPHPVVHLVEPAAVAAEWPLSLCMSAEAFFSFDDAHPLCFHNSTQFKNFNELAGPGIRDRQERALLSQ